MKGGSPWTEKEDKVLLHAVENLRWSKKCIRDSLLPHRTEEAIKARMSRIRHSEKPFPVSPPVKKKRSDRKLPRHIMEKRMSKGQRLDFTKKAKIKHKDFCFEIFEESNNHVSFRVRKVHDCRLRQSDMKKEIIGRDNCWTQDECNALLTARKNGQSFDYIHKHVLPGRSKSSISQKSRALQRASKDDEHTTLTTRTQHTVRGAGAGTGTGARAAGGRKSEAQLDRTTLESDESGRLYLYNDSIIPRSSRATSSGQGLGVRGEITRPIPTEESVAMYLAELSYLASKQSSTRMKHKSKQRHGQAKHNNKADSYTVIDRRGVPTFRGAQTISTKTKA